jgi:hypothetical protein
MRTTIIIAALSAAAITQQASAQEGFNIGVRAIAHTTWMLNADDWDTSNHEYITTWGSGFGAGVGYGFSEKLGIGVDFLYSNQGQRYELKLGQTMVEFQQKNDYFKIPVMLTFNGDPSAGAMFLGKIGPQFGFLSSSKLYNADGNEIDDDTSDLFNSSDIGAMLSLGASFRLMGDNLRLHTSFRLDYSFSNAETERALQPNRAPTHNATGGFEFGLSYFLN